ncbi:MAG: endonuclease III [Mariprofundaceae bacterium]|nr:endonuclease III [Mariprofundaceae bacterium]
MNTENTEAIFERFYAANPEPKTELDYNNSFELLVAVMLSAQSTDIAVNKVSKKLFAAAPTPQAILDLGQSTIKKHIASLGLYNNKSKYLIGLCRLLVDSFQGQVPADRKSLESLPGVGRKTANVVLNVAFGEATMAVDTHLFRLGNRIGIAPGKKPLDVEKGLLANIPDKFMVHAHHWLILHGRYVCTARKPKCMDCLIYDLCQWSEKG